MQQDTVEQNYQLLSQVVNHYLGCPIDCHELKKQVISLNVSKNLILVQEVEVHGVGPFFYLFIKQHNIETQTEIKRQLQSLTLRHKFAAEARAKVLGDVMSVFKQNNIELILLKGVALAHMIYPEPLYRPMRDIDILISKFDQAKAKTLLEQQGFIFDDAHASIYMGDIHHLPNAIKLVDGLKISLEVHHEIYSRDVEGSQTFEQIIEKTQSLDIDERTIALTLDHISMLNHLCRHTFSPAPEVRLIHQCDILKYADKYFDEIPWYELKQQNHFIINTIRCLKFSLNIPARLKQIIDMPEINEVEGVGQAMLPYTHILSKKKSFLARFKALFLPSPWWMHVNYNIPPEKTLIWCYLSTHPRRVFKDISVRMFHAIRNSIRNAK